MLAGQVMTPNPVAVPVTLPIEDCARILLDKRISAVPVVDDDNRVIGIVSEGDLMRRRETGTERRYSWWLELVSDPQSMARDFVKSSGHKVSDVMTKQVVSVSEDTPLAAIADILERHRIKRVPVVRSGRLVGIVSRADLVRSLLAGRAAPAASTASDADIRDHFLARLDKEPWGPRSYVNIIVNNGQVELWGFAGSPDEARAIGLLAEDVPGVRGVVNNVRVGEHAKYLF
ncbi:MAG TPA: CBS domain-containing protein [Alphaproteobacteria bacterium]|jgi:CBS domain-containing protein